MPWPALRATAFLVGTIIGAGIFALPAAGARAGFPAVAAWLVLLSVLLLVLHLMYGEVILRTPKRHRLPGYARMYLGQWGWRWGLLSAWLSSIGGLLIYLVLIAQFSSHLLSFIGAMPYAPNVFVWALLVAAVAAGLRTVASIDLVMAGLVIILMTLIAAFGFSRTHADFLLVTGSLRAALLPYGVLLFALSGTIAIPEIREFFTRQSPWFRRSIILGTLIASVLYGFFTAGILGAFGAAVSDDLFVTLAPFGKGIQAVLALFGLAAVATSFLSVATYLVDTLHYDMRVRRSAALAVLALPLILYFLGANDFVLLVAFVGAVFGFIDSVLILLVWRKARTAGELTPWYTVPLPAGAAYGMIGVLFAGTLVALSTLL